MSARSCRDVRADLSAYLDGDLDTGQTDAIRAHLDGCEACRSELELLRLAVGALRRLPELPPPAAILTGIRARLRPEPWYRRLLEGRQWQLGMPIGALATVLVVVGIALFQSRYPEMQKSVTQGPYPQSPAPPAREMQAKPASIAPASQARQAAPIAAPAPANRSLVADRRSVPPTRNKLRAEGDLGTATLPKGASLGKETASAESTVIAGADADKKDVFRAAPAATAQPVAPIAPPAPVTPNTISAGRARVDQLQQSDPELRGAASKDALREESRPVQNLEAAPPQSAIQTSKSAAETKVMANEYPTEQAASVADRPVRDSAVLDEVGENSRTNASFAEKKRESRVAFDRNEENVAGMRYAKLAGKKAAESTRIEIVCLLSPDGGTVDDLERLLRREGAGNLVVDVLEPRAVRETSARQRGQLGLLIEPTRGWTVTASIAPSEIARLLDVLKSQKSLRILGQPATPAASKDQAEPLALRITVLR